MVTINRKHKDRVRMHLLLLPLIGIHSVQSGADNTCCTLGQTTCYASMHTNSK